MVVGEIKKREVYSSKGFTILEILIAVAIFTVAILMTTGTMVVSQRIKEKVENMRLVQEEARFMAEMLGREIEAAEVGGLIVKESPDSNESGILEVRRIENGKESMIYETFRPSVDNKYMEMVVQKGAQTLFERVNSERTVLKKLKFSPLPACEGFPVDYVNVELLLEEASKDKQDASTGAIKPLDSILGKPASMEIHFTAVPRNK